mgnify:FL=1
MSHDEHASTVRRKTEGVKAIKYEFMNLQRQLLGKPDQDIFVEGQELMLNGTPFRKLRLRERVDYLFDALKYAETYELPEYDISIDQMLAILMWHTKPLNPKLSAYYQSKIGTLEGDKDPPTHLQVLSYLALLRDNLGEPNAVTSDDIRTLTLSCIYILSRFEGCPELPPVYSGGSSREDYKSNEMMGMF